MGIAVLENPEIRGKALPITVPVYHRLYHTREIQEAVELFEGVIVEKMPKSPLHSTLISKLVRFLRGILSDGLELRQEQPLTFERSELEPDIAIVAGKPDDYIEHHPAGAELVIEIAVTSLAYDREKAAVYAAAGIPEFWIIDAADEKIEIYRGPSGGKYTDHSVRSFADSVGLPTGGELSLANL